LPHHPLRERQWQVSDERRGRQNDQEWKTSIAGPKPPCASDGFMIG
jgi:hypothetical protein